MNSLYCDVCDKTEDAGADELDSDGLSGEYDVIIQGTGLVESILACAIARSGRKVLHIDKNDYYGRNEASHSLDSILKLCQLKNSSNQSINLLNQSVNTDPIMSYEFSTTLEPSYKIISFRNLLNEPNISEVNNSLEKLTRPNLLDLSKRFNLDFPYSGLIFGSGVVVDNLIKSNVANYLEFQSIQGLLYMQRNQIDGEIISYNVPCSKGDVFQSKLLTIIEKRILMKFLQAVVDWGRINEGTDVLKLNEIDLSSGRSLYRPQNKDINNHIFTDQQLNMKWHDFLISYQLTEKLINIVDYSLCLYSKPILELSVKDGLIDLYRHLISLGKFGESPFLLPLYGIGEISQAFCRMCAVWGGIYILRRSVKNVSIYNDNYISITDDTNKIIKCNNFICSIDDWKTPNMSNKSVLNYVGVFSGLVLDIARSVTIIPPNEISGYEHNTIFIIQQDSMTNSCPEGYSVISITTEIESISDESAIDLIRKIVTTINKSNVYEEFFCISTRPLYCEDDLGKPLVQSNKIIPIYLVGCSSYSISIHTYFQQAFNIFNQLFPNEDFLKAFSDVKTELDEGYIDADEENDFRQLESTLNFLNSKTEKYQENQEIIGNNDNNDLNLSKIDEIINSNEQVEKNYTE